MLDFIQPELMLIVSVVLSLEQVHHGFRTKISRRLLFSILIGGKDSPSSCKAIPRCIDNARVEEKKACTRNFYYLWRHRQGRGRKRRVEIESPPQ